MQSRLIRSTTNIGLLVLVNLLWSTQFISFKLVSKEMGPITVSFSHVSHRNAHRAWLFFAERWKGNPPNRSVPRADRSFWRWQNLGGFLVIGVLAAAPGSILSASGIARTTASNGALLSLTVPVLTALLAAVILREHMTLVRWASLICAWEAYWCFRSNPPSPPARKDRWPSTCKTWAC